MATIVRSAKDPWWTPLAVNVLGGLWNKWQENEANRKANAFKGQLAQDLAALAGGSQQNSLADSIQGNMLNTQNEPEGYNSNGWASALHNNYSPLTQFDFGTNNIIPQNTAPQNTAVQNAAPRSLTAMDIYNAAMTRAAQKRFSHLSPQSINDIVNPYIKMNEDAKQERRRQEAADAYLNAGNDIDRLNSLYGRAIRGDIPQSVLTSGQELYKYNNPDLQRFAHNAGDRTYFYNWNPRTGQYNQAGEFANTLTPQQSMANQLELMRLGEQQRQFNVQQENWERRFRHDTQPTYTMRAMGDGKLYWVDNRGSTIAPVTDGNGNHMDALPSEAGANTLSEAEKAYFREMENRTKGLRNEISGLQRRREKAESTEYPEIDRQLKAKQDELNKLNAERDARLQSILTRSFIGTRSQTTQQNPAVLPPVGQENLPVTAWQTQDGTIIKPEKVQELITRAGNGNLDNIHTPAELYAEFRRKGFTPLNGLQPSTRTTPAQTAPTSPDIAGNMSIISRDRQPASRDVAGVSSGDIQPGNTNVTGLVGSNDNTVNTSNPYVNTSAANTRSYSFSGRTNNGGQYRDIINRHSENFGVDPDLIVAIIQQESAGNSNAKSKAGAMGLMQLMPATAKGLGVNDPYNPDQNVKGGTQLISQLLKRYGGDVRKALWAYNAGAGNVAKNRMPQETRNYIPRVLERYRKLKEGSRTGKTIANTPTYTQSATPMPSGVSQTPEQQATPQTVPTSPDVTGLVGRTQNKNTALQELLDRLNGQFGEDMYSRFTRTD